MLSITVLFERHRLLEHHSTVLTLQCGADVAVRY